MRSRRQSGSIVILVAGAMVALLTMTALIFAAGSTYWTRRHLQELGDTAALSGATAITTVCNSSTANAVVTAAQSVIASQLQGGSGLIVSSGSCSAVGSFTYPGNAQATITYPYDGNLTKVEVRLQQVTPFQLNTFLGLPTSSVQARSVAKFLGAVPSYAFAVYASNRIDCNGSSTVTVHGSIYAVNGIEGNPDCSLVTRAIRDPSNTYYADFGNMLAWADGQSWTCSRTCADGYQLSGHSASTCGSTGTQFLDATQVTYNSNPCPGGFAAKRGYAQHFDPNTSAPNPVSGKYQAAGQAGCDQPGTPDPGNGWVLYAPGCFTSMDVNNQPLGLHKVKLQPGFYYFGANGGLGLCLSGGGQLLGSDVTLEFVGNASMTTRNCDLSGGCAAACGFGSGPAAMLTAPPTALLGGSSWCGGSCPSRGLLIYYANPAPGTGTGQFLTDGAGNTSWMKGTVFWQNASCTWAATGTSTIAGQLACGDVHLGGTTLAAAGPALDLTASNLAVPEAALVE